MGACAHVSPQPQKIDLEKLAAAIDSTRVSLRIPGLSFAVVEDGRVVMARGLGFADVEAKAQATPETVYPIGSITKTFTSTLMLKLAEQGRLDLDAVVATLVDWEVAPNILVRHVLSHTSEGAPGSRFVYSSRFNWLDNVVEAATQDTFRVLLTKQLLEPARLAQTFAGEATDGYAERLPGLAKPYKLGNNGEPVRSQYPPMALHSSSGLSSTVLDLARYSTALDAGEILSAQARSRAFSPTISTRGDTLPYGLGWYTERIAGQRVVWHPSWWPNAYSGLLVKVPERNVAFVVLANSDALTSPQNGSSSILLYPAAHAFLRHLLGRDSPELRATQFIGDALTARAAGDHAHSDTLLKTALLCCGDIADLLSDDNQLVILGESSDSAARAAGQAAGRRILENFPDDASTMFSLGMSYGRVRPDLRVNGPTAAEAIAAFDRILALTPPIPRWMEAWTNYLVAEHIARSDPTRARTLVERAIATRVDTDGLQARATRLLETLR